MKLFLHIGSEKTGSSYLQTICVLGREELRAAGVYFPKGIPRHENRMSRGLVSAGNGVLMSSAIERGEWNRVEDQLSMLMSEGRRKKCPNVFLSSELLLHSLAKQGAVARLTKLARQAGFDGVSALLFLRDPVGQLLSLYQHRAKRGTAGTLEVWARNGYTLPADLRTLRPQLGCPDFDLRIRAYSSESGYLEQVLFGEWARVCVPKVEMPETINPSLSLAELESIRMLARLRPGLVPILYDRLVKLDRSDKVQGRELEAHARAIAERSVAAHQDEWVEWNALLPVSEQLVIPQPEGELPPEPQEIAFSRKQMEVLVCFVAESVEPRFLVKLLWTGKIRPFLAGLKQVIMMGIRQ